MNLAELIDKAGRLDTEIKTKEKRLAGMKVTIAKMSVKGNNLGEKYVCKKVVSDVYSNMEPNKVKEQFNWLMIDEKEFLSCCKMQLAAVKEFLSPKMVAALRSVAGEKIALSFKKR